MTLPSAPDSGAQRDSIALPVFSDALAAWRAGDHDAARAQCQRLLAADPQNIDALHLAGILEIGRDRLTARALIERAVALRVEPRLLVGLALTFDSHSESDMAIATLARALELDPDYPHALNNLANLYDARGEHARAAALLERLVKREPDNGIAHFNLGTIMFGLGDYARAEAEMHRAIELDPHHINAWNNLANVLIATRRKQQALAMLTHALTFAPDDVNLLTNLGSLMRDAGRIDEAQATLERAVTLAPDNAPAWNNYGNVFVDLGDVDRAQRAFARAIELKPNFSDAWSNYGNALKASGDIAAAIDAYRHALMHDAGNEGAHSNLVYANLFATEDGMAIRAEAELYAVRHDAAQPGGAAPLYANTPDPARRLRIGYVSPDFRNHCQSLFTLPVFAQHDHANFEIVCYSSAQPDEVTTRLTGMVDRWRDVREFDDARLSQQIRDDGIDILVDLTMHMAHTRRALFAMRPAPVQMAWLAYPGTTGSAAIGWRLTDPWLDPVGAPGVDEQYTERSLRLPDTFWCYAPLEVPHDVTALPALTAGHITFGCLNNPCKLTDATFALWSGVFAALPDARLVLMAPQGSARERMLARLAAHGIGEERVRFVGFQPRADYLRTWAQIDIALDTVPYNGHTTSLDAFWMGVPVPTRVGRAVAGRAGLSLLANLGLQELAAYDDAAYTQTVVALAHDLPRLATLRAGFRARMQASPLMDGARFARHMEAAWRHMWQTWCASAQRPTHIDDAEAALRHAIATTPAGSPKHARAWSALGDLLFGKGRTADAQTAYRAALAANPDDADALSNLGSLLAAAKQHAEAEPLIARAVTLRPGSTEAWRNLGNLYAETQRSAEAIDAYTRAVEIDPSLAQTHELLGGLLMRASEMGASVAAMRRAVASDPTNAGAHADLAYAMMYVTDDGALIRAEAERFSQQHEAALLAAPALYAHSRDKVRDSAHDPARRLRIGYVSPDFRNHCQSLFTLPLFSHHDHAEFEIVCYASVAEPDPITQRIQQHVDLWRDVHALDDAQLAQQIRADGVDILVDLTMHMANARRRLFAMRPAPVQVAWLAYPGTTGSAAIDWRITDPWLDPPGVPGVDEQYTERSLRLPDTFWCYAPLDEADRSVAVSALPALDAGHITFGCLNNPCKLSDDTLAQWSPIFAALPNARLILLATSGTLLERLKRRLAAHGIDPARVTFIGYQQRLAYLNTWAQIDIALDTFPYTGHTTTLDAFWMGVPVPTRAGRVAASRAGLSLLANLGLADLGASDAAGYAQTVVALAHDLPRLAALRAGLRARMQASPLMDGARFARNMEAAYRSMWRDWCEVDAKQQPERAL
ncbi:tetratricopeptide repeat protein [Burkholderia sp. Ax-1719]|uniref:O-linked N-acetylglucosamine transferase, SPINDLY family protein n=1 Tax=Burkholderia sp. Ax-1719 TaxID=2608334 RepID=UPI001423F374|nr:tetratricopeptide repeat protein [Burkholderia sp. Ax-1719]NIE69127.1 tetratricopeptide repeat protein [Burkholderia sp. Ax-1719]